MYPTLMLLCVCVCVCACSCVRVACDEVSVWVGLVSWWRLIFLDLERSSNVHCLLSSASVLSLHTHPHFSNFQSLALQSESDLAFDLFINWFLMITHACLKACPSAFCQANREYVSVKSVFTSRSLLTQLVCSNEWTTFFTCHSSAMLLSMVMTFDCSCHPTLTDASMIWLPSLWFYHCGLRSHSWLSEFHITAWNVKTNDVPFLIVSLTWTRRLHRKHATEVRLAALLRLTPVCLVWNQAIWFDCVIAWRDAFSNTQPAYCSFFASYYSWVLVAFY